MAEHSPRKLAVLLHADVVASTALVQRDEALAHERIRDAFHRFSGTIESHNGHPLELRGDALLAEFSRASDAVAASLAFQAENTRFNSTLEDDIQPALRVGISLGEVVVADNTVTGEGIVLAQRLEQLAPAGGVCVHGAVYETVPGRLPFEYESLGEQELKGFREPVRAYVVSLKSGEPIPRPETDAMRGGAQRERPRQRWVVVSAMALLVIAVAGLAWFQPWTPGEEPTSVERTALPLPDKPSIAVLPFTNMSDDQEQEYFSDGITESIITTLTRIPGFFVIARNSTFSYKGKDVKVDEVARDLGVRYVLQGSVQRAGASLRVTAQLIDTQTGSHVWAERYDRKLEDIFSVQDDVTKRVATALAIELTEGDMARISSQQTSSLEAYEYYLQAKNIPAMFTPVSNEKAKALLSKALALDSTFLPAIVELAWKHTFDARFSWTDDVAKAWARAEALNDQALSLNPESADALHLAGYLSLYRDGDYERGVRMAGEGARLEPSNADVRAGYGWLLLGAMRAEEAANELEQALRLGPKRAPWIVDALGRANELLGRYDEAASAFEEVVERVPAGRLLADSNAWLALVQAARGREEQARAAMAAALEAFPSLSATQYRRRMRMKDPSALEQRIAVLQGLGLPD